VDDEGNDGHANFPEYQNVYIEPCAYEALQEDKRVSRWHDLLQGVPTDFAWAEPDGSRTEPSGRATSQALPLHLMKAAAAATADAAS
jgi:hypothetical protein